MKIKLHIILRSFGFLNQPRFHKVIDFEITPQNFGDVLRGEFSVLVGENFYKVKVDKRQWDKINQTLSTESLMRESECNGYLKQIESDGWEEIPKNKPYQPHLLITSSGR